MRPAATKIAVLAEHKGLPQPNAKTQPWKLSACVKWCFNFHFLHPKWFPLMLEYNEPGQHFHRDNHNRPVGSRSMGHDF